MVTTNFNQLHGVAHNRLNLRKAQRSIGLIGRRADVDRIDFRSMNVGELPDFVAAGFHYVGRVTTDGWTFGRDEDTDEATSHGFPDPGRIDVESVTRTVSTTAQETFRKIIREITKGTRYGDEALSFDANNFLVLEEPDWPEHDEWTLITLFRDRAEGKEMVFGRQFGSVILEEAGEESFGGEGVLEQEITWRVLRDETTGTPYEEFYGGPGFVALAESLGYNATGEVESGE